MLVLPMSTALAEQPEKIPLRIVGGPVPGGYSTPEIWVSGNIQHGRGATGIMPMCYIVRDDPMQLLMVGSATQIWDYNVNIETGQGVAHFKFIIVLGEGTPTDTSDDGTFEGKIHITGEFVLIGDNSEYANAYNTHSYGVIRGTGAYQGWKIILETTVVDGDFESSNYLFKR